MVNFHVMLIVNTLLLQICAIKKHHFKITVNKCKIECNNLSGSSYILKLRLKFHLVETRTNEKIRHSWISDSGNVIVQKDTDLCELLAVHAEK